MFDVAVRCNLCHLNAQTQHNSLQIISIALLRKQPQHRYVTLLADAVTVHARTLLQMPQWFLQFCEATGPQLAHLGTGMSSATGEQLLLAFLDRWLDKFDSIGTPAARKLSALALCNVLTLPVTPILDRLDPIAAHLTSVWFEVRPLTHRSRIFCSCACCQHHCMCSPSLLSPQRCTPYS